MSYLFTVQLSRGGQNAVRTAGGDELSPPPTGGGGQYTMVVEPEMLGVRLGASLAGPAVPAIEVSAGQQLDLSSLTDLGEGEASAPRVHVFLADD
jgi:hypothetical protein